MVVILSALSGCVWGVIGAYLLTDGRMDARSWGGLLASPLIGIAAGMAATRFRDLSGISRILVPLASLYAAAALFGFAAGAWSAVFGVVPLGQAGAPSSSLGLIIQYVFLVLVFLTVSGYGLILWPLAVLNHLLIWQWTARQSTCANG
jgi:hypothetical protein